MFFQGRIRVLVYFLQHVAIIEWTSNPVSDMFADATLAAILHAQTNPIPDKSMFFIFSRFVCIVVFFPLFISTFYQF